MAFQRNVHLNRHVLLWLERQPRSCYTCAWFSRRVRPKDFKCWFTASLFDVQD